MFPISKETISLRDIADYWSREISPPATVTELLDLMVRAWWLGEFAADAPPRLEVLKKMFAKRNDENELNDIVFLIGNEVQQSIQNKSLGGTFLVDIRPRVQVPSKTMDEWDNAQCEIAFAVLGSDEVSHVEHYPSWGAAFQWFRLGRVEFLNWLISRGYSLPRFWGGFNRDLAQVQSRGKKGPKPGELRRYDAEDRALFAPLEKIIKEQNMSASAAAQSLAEAGKIAGTGSHLSRAKRLTALFRRERANGRPSGSR
jgi:hypothetical protein